MLSRYFTATLGCLLAVCCTPAPPERSSASGSEASARNSATTEVSASAAPSSAPKGSERFACRVDDDCMNSCNYGAVSRSWYEAVDRPECQDGCNNQLQKPARCLEGSCVAFKITPDGKTVHRDEHCTSKQAQ